MDFETLFKLSENSENKGKISDEDGKVLVEYQPYQTYRDQLNAGIGNSAAAFNRYVASRLSDSSNIAFSAQQYEEMMSKAKNVLPWPLDKMPDEFKVVWDTLRNMITQFGQAYSGNVMLTSEQKKLIKKDIERIQKIQKLLFKMLNELGSFEK